MANKVIISRSKMISLANAIRSITGSTAPLSIDSIIQTIHTLNSSGGTNIGGLYQTGAVEAYRALGDDAINDLLVTSWNDLISDKTIISTTDSIVPGQILPELPEKNQYGFYFGVPYNYLGSEYSVKFFEDGSVEETFEGESFAFPAGSAIYSQNTADMTNPDIDYDIAYFSEDGTVMTWWDEKYFVGSPILLNGDLFIPNTYGAQLNFSSQTLLTGVVLPKDLTYINNYAFSYCTSLTEIVIPNSVTSIGDSVFEGCENIQNIELPNSVTSIGVYAFDCCENTENVYYNGTVEDWCNIIFSGYGGNPLSYAKYIYMKNEDDAYYLLTSLVIPSTITTIGRYQFYYCINLTKIVIPNSVTSIGEYAFSGTGITEIVIPDSVTSIGESVFDHCTSLAEIVIPESVTSIDDYAFRGTGITEIVIPNSVTSIGKSAFAYCTGITEIVIPNSVTSIGNYAFDGCTGITEIVIPNSVTSIGDYAFDHCTNVEFLQVPFSSTINQLSDLFHATPNTSLKKVVITSGTSLDYSAFYGCTSLTEIVLPDSITSIGNYAFRDCTGLTEIVIPNSVTSIGNSAFSGCENIQNIELPNSVTSIGNYAFDGCTGITEIVIPDSVTSIGYNIFQGCTNVEFFQVSFNSTITGIYELFGTRNLTTLKKVVITNSTSISSHAFYGYTSITEVVIPDSVTSIGDNAFAFCANLTKINYMGTVAQWNSINKQPTWDYSTGTYTIYCTDGSINK